MKNNQSERKKSSMPLRINRKSFFGVLSLIAQELIESISTKLKLKKPKEEEVLINVRLKAEPNNPNSVLNIIDNYAYKKTFLMNIGHEKGLLLENSIKQSKAK